MTQNSITVMKQKQTHRHRNQTCDCQGGRGVEWAFGISRNELMYIEWISNKVLLYSTGNYIQYPITNHNEEEPEKECVGSSPVA